MKKSNKFNRRDVLKTSLTGALGMSHLNTVAQLVLNGFINNAIAQELGILNKKYLYIQEAMAPPRYHFDCPMYPAGDKENFIDNGGYGTRFKGSTRYTDVEYATTKVEGLDMPWLWQFDIPKSDGSWISMDKLASEGMFIIRGCSNNNPAHGPAQILHFKPVGIKTSINALAADHSDSPVGALNLSATNYRFNSSKGLSSSYISNGGNMLEKILVPFQNANEVKDFKNNQQKIINSISSSKAALDKLAHGNHQSTDIITKATTNAISLFKKDFGDLASIYQGLYDKYKNLIDRAIDPTRTLVGINDKHVGNDGTRNNWYRNSANRRLPNDDLRTMIRANYTHANRMAEHFAVAEFSLINNITSSVTIRPGGLSRIYMDGASYDQFFDEHYSGKMVSLIENTYYRLAQTSCLYELISILKDKGLYNNTVIDLAGDFGRIPRADGTGSDHSPEAGCNTFFSGMFDGLSVVGNIAQNGNTYSPGTWGNQAPVPGFGLLTIGHMGSTLAHLLGVPSPITSASTLLKVEGGKFVSKIPTGKIIK